MAASGCRSCVREYLRGEVSCRSCGGELSREVLARRRRNRVVEFLAAVLNPPEHSASSRQDKVGGSVCNWRNPLVVHLVGAIISSVILLAILCGV